MHAGGTSIAGIAPNNDGYSELVEDVVRVPWDDADEMIATIDRIGEENIAALPKGLSRHTVRFAHLSGHVIAIKETLPDLARREYEMLKEQMIQN